MIKNKLPKFLERSQVKSLVDGIPDNSFSKYRDKLVVRLLALTGLRISEALTLVGSNQIKDRRVLRVLGKGNKKREVPINSECEKVIAELESINGKTENGFLIVNKLGERISARYFQKVIKKYSKRILGPDGEITPHKLRHTFASMLRQNGAPLEMIQKLLGHESILTTSIYLHIPGREERYQLDQLSYK
jgi:site-specific recombinase XerD